MSHSITVKIDKYNSEKQHAFLCAMADMNLIAISKEEIDRFYHEENFLLPPLDYENELIFDSDEKFETFKNVMRVFFKDINWKSNNRAENISIDERKEVTDNGI